MSAFRLSKNNSLKSTSSIDNVFKRGQKISSELISLYYVKSSGRNLRFAFSVGKKSHNLASTRNKLKRLMKEALRVNGHEILSQNLPYNLIFIYFSSKEESFKSIEESMKSLLLSFKNKKLS